MAEKEFRTIEPKILYFGTPVALISSLNENGNTNLAPIVSFWAQKCPVQMEARVIRLHKMSGDKLQQLGGRF